MDAKLKLHYCFHLNKILSFSFQEGWSCLTSFLFVQKQFLFIFKEQNYFISRIFLFKQLVQKLNNTYFCLELKTKI
jgi:type II secretory pathway component PulF